MKKLLFVLCLLGLNIAPAEARKILHCIETGTIMIPSCNGGDFMAGIRSIKVTMHREVRRASRPHHGARDRAVRSVQVPEHGIWRAYDANPELNIIKVAVNPQIVAHPAGCPARAFCGCGAAVRVFGAPIRALWLASNWFKFPRTEPAPGMVAVRNHHVFVLESPIGGRIWMAYDANSGRHATRIHPRSIAGYAIVNPRGYNPLYPNRLRRHTVTTVTSNHRHSPVRTAAIAEATVITIRVFPMVAEVI